MPPRHTEPVQWRQEGENQELLAGMRPAARAALGWLFNLIGPSSGVRQGYWTMDLGEGKKGAFHAVAIQDPNGFKRAFVTLRATVPEKPSLEDTWKFIFESGAINVTNLGGGEYATTLYLGTFQVEGNTPTTDINQDGFISGGDRLWPLGEVELSTPETPLAGDLVPAVGAAGSSRVLTTGDKLGLSLYVPASLFSGRMRFFVQCLYGMYRSDVLFSGASLWPSLQVNGFSFGYIGSSSQWLYVNGAWRFFIVQPSISGESITVRFRELVAGAELKDEEIALRDWAIERLGTLFPDGQGDREPWALMCLQALVLGLSSPATEETDSVTIDAPSTTYPLGEPLAYGWHSTWTGDQAKITLLNPDPYVKAVVSTVLTMDITSSGTGESITFGAACSASEHTASIDNNFLVWVPTATYVVSEGSFLSHAIYQCTTASPGDFTISSPPATYNIPIYGWYDDDGDWIELRIKKETTANNLQDDPWQPETVCHGSTVTRSGVSNQSVATKRTISLGGQSVSETHQTADYIRWKSSHIGGGSAYWTYGDGIYMTYGNCMSTTFDGCGSGCILGTNWYYITPGVGSASYSIINGYSSYGSVAAVLLHNDCESAALISSLTGGATSGSNYHENGNTLDAGGHLVTSVNYDNYGSPGDVRWSGSQICGKTTYESGSFYGYPPGTSTSWAWASTTRYTVLGRVGSEAKTITSWSVRDGDSGAPEDAFHAAGVLSLPNPYGSSSGTPDADWAAFLESPAAVCSNGERGISLDPAASMSAVERAAFSFGVPNSGITTGDYAGGYLFIGVA